MEIVHNFGTVLQHLYFVDLLLELSFVRNDGYGKNMAAIEANGKVTC